MVLAGWVTTWAIERETAPQSILSQKRRTRGLGIELGIDDPPRGKVGAFECGVGDSVAVRAFGLGMPSEMENGDLVFAD